MKIFVVIENDRGMGVCLIAAYHSKESAESHASQSSHFYVEETEILD